MKNKKTLNLVLSLCIILCTLVCVCMALSDSLQTLMFQGEGSIESVNKLNWRVAGPLIGFASVAALLSLIKLIMCSLPAQKDNKALGAIAIVFDILGILSLGMIASSIGIWNGDIGISKFEKALTSCILLLEIGSPVMLVCGLGSWISNSQAAK